VLRAIMPISVLLPTPLPRKSRHAVPPTGQKSIHRANPQLRVRVSAPGERQRSRRIERPVFASAHRPQRVQRFARPSITRPSRPSPTRMAGRAPQLETTSPLRTPLAIAMAWIAQSCREIPRLLPASPAPWNRNLAHFPDRTERSARLDQRPDHLGHAPRSAIPRKSPAGQSRRQQFFRFRAHRFPAAAPPANPSGPARSLSVALPDPARRFPWRFVARTAPAAGWDLRQFPASRPHPHAKPGNAATRRPLGMHQKRDAGRASIFSSATRTIPISSKGSTCASRCNTLRAMLIARRTLLLPVSDNRWRARGRNLEGLRHRCPLSRQLFLELCPASATPCWRPNSRTCLSWSAPRAASAAASNSLPPGAGRPTSVKLRWPAQPRPRCRGRASFQRLAVCSRKNRSPAR